MKRTHHLPRRYLWIAAIAMLVSLALLCTGCQNEVETESETETETGVAIAVDGTSVYRLIRGDRASDREIRAAVALRDALEAAGITLPIQTDFEAVTEGVPEICVGTTNRYEGDALAPLAYEVRILENGNVIIRGGSEGALDAAVAQFIQNHVSGSTLRLPDAYQQEDTMKDVFYAAAAWAEGGEGLAIYATQDDAKAAADENKVYGWRAFDANGEVVYCPYTILQSDILREAKWVCDYVRDNEFVYGDAPINPAIDCTAKKVSCDRLVCWSLYRAGYVDQVKKQGVVVYGGYGSKRDLTTWCKNYGFTRVEKVEDLEPGDVVFVKPSKAQDGTIFPGHTFIFAGKSGEGTYYRYDGGSNTRIQSTQPSSESIDEFMYGYRPVVVPEGTVTKNADTSKK